MVKKWLWRRIIETRKSTKATRNHLQSSMIIHASTTNALSSFTRQLREWRLSVLISIVSNSCSTASCSEIRSKSKYFSSTKPRFSSRCRSIGWKWLPNSKTESTTSTFPLTASKRMDRRRAEEISMIRQASRNRLRILRRRTIDKKNCKCANEFKICKFTQRI